MKTLLLLLLCVPVYAAPFPVVKRPAPLLSPKAASAPKSTAMVKATIPTTVPMAPVFLTYQKDINVLHCATNDPNCMLYDITNVSAVQRAGFGLVLEFADSVTESQWAFAANSSAGTEDRVVEMQWMHTADQRLVSRFFRAREVPGPIGVRSATTTAPLVKVNPAIPGLRAWIAPKRK